MKARTLDPYQERGVAWLAGNKRRVLYLADQMRVGKTPQVAEACARVRAERVVVVCPAIVRANWLNDFRDFCSDPRMAKNAVLVYSATDAAKITDATRLVIVSYDLLGENRVYSAIYTHCVMNGLDVLALDEAHYLKETDSKRTRLILGKSSTGAEGLAGLADRTWWVSGTPILGYADDLFTFCRHAGLWPKSKQDFIKEFCFGYHDGYEFQVTGSKNLEKLRAMIAPVTLRRLRKEISKAEVRIGSLTIEPREINPLDHVLGALRYQEPKLAAIVSKALKEGTLDRLPIKSTATTRRLIGMAKVAGMIDIAKRVLDADPDKKIVIFGIHREPLRWLRNMLRDYGPILLFGGMAAKKRENLVQSFKDNPNRRVAICNLTAASVGIDLSVADEVYIFEASWTPADNAQALSRIINVRAANPEPKEAWFVGLANSIDDAVTRVYEKKAREIGVLYSAV